MTRFLVISEPLARKILEKQMIIDHSTREAIESKISACQQENENMIKSAYNEILRELPDILKRLTLLNSEKRASVWLTTLPL